MSFLSYAVFFAVIHAFGTPLQGILRAYKDVRIISYISLFSYWGVCFPVAYILSRIPEVRAMVLDLDLAFQCAVAPILFYGSGLQYRHKT